MTFVNNEPIALSQATYDFAVEDCTNCFIIDGTIDNQTQVYRIWEGQSVVKTKSNAVTVVTFQDHFLGVVLNPPSLYNQFNLLVPKVTHPNDHIDMGMLTPYPGYKDCWEIVNFNSTGIIFDDLKISSENCTAWIMSGPPNNSSKILLDISTAKTPHVFGDLQYFSIVNTGCIFNFPVRSA